jgi:dephospho-CoA kinase
MSSTKLVVAITGGIGSGKSTVAELFAHHGVPIIDTDQISRDLTTKGSPALQAISDQFGESLLKNGELIRKSLRQLVFADPEKRIWLEELLHPLIREEMQKQVDALTTPYCMIIIPLLFENPANPLINRILVVDTDEELQLARVAQRDLHSIIEVEAIMETQVSRQVRLDGADDIIFNTAGPEYLVPQVEKLHLAYLALADAKSL